ncbi:lipoprotein insertase outer membrane protein LolB [Undibacterium arcticum]|uniref:lipoprotein insertase outer membrane protein LolB n=1 Tax=Undibacterium arcticum TaxID=1762892 RepID=UPI00361A1537
MLLPVLLSACAAINQAPAQRTGLPGMQQLAARPYRDNIDLSGRLSVLYQQDGKDQAVHGSFNWIQSGDRAGITLLSPLGQTMATIEVGPRSSTLTKAGRAPRAAADVDALAADALGWPLPVAGLREWLQGFATNVDGRRFIASAQNDSVNTRDGWRIRYVSWQDEPDRNGATITHPKRIDLARSTAQAGEVSMRIVIDSWQAR